MEADKLLRDRVQELRASCGASTVPIDAESRTDGSVGAPGRPRIRLSGGLPGPGEDGAPLRRAAGVRGEEISRALPRSRSGEQIYSICPSAPVSTA